MQHRVQESWHPKPQTVHQHHPIPHQLELKDIGVFLPVVEITREVARRTQQEYYRRQYPKRTVEVGFVIEFLNKLTLERNEVLFYAIQHLLLTHLKPLLIKGQAEKTTTALRVRLLNFGL
jgi:hypothetical protein